MNDKPNVTGITRYWKRGEDDRVVLAEAMGLDPKRKRDRAKVDSVLTPLCSIVMCRPRTKFVGFGVFKWIKWRNRIPTGQFVETWRLTFKPSRHVEGKYDGDK